MVDFRPSLRGTLQATVPSDQIIATTNDAIAGTSNVLIMTPLLTREVLDVSYPVNPINFPDVFLNYFLSLPTSDPGIPNVIWNNGGVLCIST